jgi:hypothetical protein
MSSAHERTLPSISPSPKWTLHLFAERRRRSLEQAEDLYDRRANDHKAKECDQPLGCWKTIVLVLRSLSDGNITPLEERIYICVIPRKGKNEAQQG